MRPWLNATDNKMASDKMIVEEIASMRPWLNATDNAAERAEQARLLVASMRPWLNATDNGPPQKQGYHNNLQPYLRGVSLSDPTARGEELP